MVIVMTASATDEDLAEVVQHVESAGGSAFVSRGVMRTIVGVVGTEQVLETSTRAAARGGRDDPDHRAVQAGSSARTRPAQHGRGRRGADRAGHVHADRRAVRGRDARADAGGGAAGPARRGDAAARRRVQAAHLAVRVPGARGRGAADPGRGQQGDRAAGGHRDHGPGRRRRGRRARGHVPDRHPQHAELPAAAGGRRGRQAGNAQARPHRDVRGVADGRGVHRPARQPRHRAVRARHPRLRAVDPQHARRVGGADGATRCRTCR